MSTYSSNGDVYWRPADGSAAAERLFARNGAQYAQQWTRDGQVLVFREEHPTNRPDIWILPRTGDPRPLIATSTHELSARLSPDERWLAYQSNESGRPEIYVRPFPNVDDGKWTVSTRGGLSPVWSPTGRELFYLNGTTMMVVPIERGPGASFDVGVPTALFEGPFDAASSSFDISPDGTYFVMVEADPNAQPTQVQVVLNWAEELKRVAGGSTQ